MYIYLIVEFDSEDWEMRTPIAFLSEKKAQEYVMSKKPSTPEKSYRIDEIPLETLSTGEIK